MALSKIQAESMNLADTYAFTGTVSGVDGKFESQLFHLQHIEASSVSGGGNTAGTNNQRTLNSTVVNQISGASVSSSNVTLPSGTYLIHATGSCFRIARHFLRWYNSSDSTYVLSGQSVFADGNNEVQNLATLWGRFTISAEKTFQLRHFTENSYSQSNALGIENNVTTNVYCNCLIWKIA